MAEEKKRKFILTINFEGPRIPMEKLYHRSAGAGHKKPSLPYSYMQVGEDGQTTPIVNSLPEEKAAQELDIAQKFIAIFNSKEIRLTNLRQLAENDHDFEVREGEDEAVIQLTEVSLRGVAYKAGDGIFVPDVSKVIPILPNAIASKIAKNYRKDSAKSLWLVLWQTESTAAVEEPSLQIARDYLSSLPGQPFDKIYFLHFYSNKPDGFIKEVFPNNEVISTIP